MAHDRMILKGPKQPRKAKPPTHDIAESNARQNKYWERVGGHPAPGYMDSDEDDSQLNNDKE